MDLSKASMEELERELNARKIKINEEFKAAALIVTLTLKNAPGYIKNSQSAHLLQDVISNLDLISRNWTNVEAWEATNVEAWEASEVCW